LFCIGEAIDFDAERLADHALEWSNVAYRGPDFELGVTGGADLQQRVVAAVVEFQRRDDLRMAAIEVFGEAQHRCQ
jgi:hypothetical protein